MFHRVINHYLHFLLGNVYSKIIGLPDTLRGKKLTSYYTGRHIRWEYVVRKGKSVVLKGGGRDYPHRESDMTFCQNQEF